MNSSLDDLGIISAFLEHLEIEAIPRALAVKAEVDSGEKLNELDLLFFDEQLVEISNILHLLDRHPEYQDVAVKMVTLYHEITDRALQNQLVDDSDRRFGNLLSKIRQWQK